MSEQAAKRPSFRLSDTPDNPVPPRDSATVILARDARDTHSSLEVFMLERVLKADFAGGAYVFPGGTFDDGDLDPSLIDLTDGPGVHDAAALMDAPPERALAFYLCAIRETFEESGALLARRAATGELVGHDPSLQSARAKLNDGSMKLKQFADDNGLRFAADLLHPFSRWVTPDASPKRYDTRFFVAEFPDDTHAHALLHDDIESQSSRWIRPTDALEQHKDGRFSIIFPTRVTLTQLARYATVADLIAAIPGRDLTPVSPQIVQIGEAIKITIPGDPEPYEP